MSKKFKIGFVVTIVYLLIILIIIFLKLSTLSALGLNELGDFLAGVFGPVAFLWLILGYLQQGEELKLNTEALELQVEELRQTVEQQRELVSITRTQFESNQKRQKRVDAKRRLETLPKFSWDNGSINSSGDAIHYATDLENNGGLATDVCIEIESNYISVSSDYFTSIDNGVKKRLKFSIKKSIDSEFSPTSGMMDVALIIHYQSKDSEPCNKVFFISLIKTGQDSFSCGGVYDEEPYVRDSGV